MLCFAFHEAKFSKGIFSINSSSINVGPTSITIVIKLIRKSSDFCFRKSRSETRRKFQSWNDVFQDDPRLQGVCQVYNELKMKGVQFPVADPGSMAPILTPKRVSLL